MNGSRRSVHQVTWRYVGAVDEGHASADRALDAGEMVVGSVERILDRVLLEPLGAHPRLRARHAQGWRDEDAGASQQRGSLLVEAIGVLEAPNSLGQRLPDRGRLAGVGDDV